MRSRRTARICTALVAVAAMAAGCGGGAQGADSGKSQESSSNSSSESSEEVETPMPDLTGMTEDEARMALTEIGVDDGDIIATPQESLLDAGTVVDTVPGAGSRMTGSITLKIAGPVGPIPDFTGEQVSEVESWAEERGIEFREVAVPDADRADGEVLGTTPEAGQTATSEIEVRVARTPSTKSLYLDEDLGENYSCYAEAGETFIDGEPYDGSFTQPDGSSCVFEFDLGRDWERLTGIVGFTDISDSGARVRVQVKIDGTSKINQVIDFGKKPLQLDVDVSEGLRLSIELSDVAGSGTVGFGDLLLVGTGPAAGAEDDTGNEVPDGTESTEETEDGLE